MPTAATNIWLPGRGMTDMAERRVDAVVKEYDETLSFGRNMDTGQYCVFLNRRGADPLPVLGFNTVPHPEDVLKALYHTDAQRRGEEILDEMNAENEEARKADQYAADEGIGIAAEGFEWLMRNNGQTPYSKHFNVSHKRNRMGGYA